jgi:hypothetical protein
MGELFGALGAGLQGLAGGLQQRKQDIRQSKQDMMDQRQFELHMKQLGLALESAQYEHDLQIASGTPKEVAQRNLQDRLRKIQEDAQTAELHKKLIEQQIDASKAKALSDTEQSHAMAQYYLGQGRQTGGGGKPQPGPLDGALKLLSNQLERYHKQHSDAIASGDIKRAKQIEAEMVPIQSKFDTLTSAALESQGLTFTPKESATPEAAPAAPAAVTPETAPTAIGSAVASVRQGIAPHLQPIADWARLLNVNTKNPQTPQGDAIAAGMAQQALGKLFNPMAYGPSTPQTPAPGGGLGDLTGLSSLMRLFGRATAYGPENGAAF